MADFGTNLKELREKHSLTQRDLAKLAFGDDADRSIISLYENGKRTPTTTRAAALAEALDTSVDWMLR